LTYVPKRLIPAAIALGSFTFTMTALPGTPAIQNAIPIPYYNTNVFAAPILGIIGGTIMLAHLTLQPFYFRLMITTNTTHLACAQWVFYVKAMLVFYKDSAIT